MGYSATKQFFLSFYNRKDRKARFCVIYSIFSNYYFFNYCDIHFLKDKFDIVYLTLPSDVILVIILLSEIKKKLN